MSKPIALSNTFVPQGGYDTVAKRPTPLVTTFYSFKGGVGRSQALYAVGQRLVQRGRRVLLVDFDLEAPGLSLALLDKQAAQSRPGVIEIASRLSNILLNLANGVKMPEDFNLLKSIQSDVNNYVVSLSERDEPELIQKIRSDFPMLKMPMRQSGLFLLSCGRIYDDYAGSTAKLRIRELMGSVLSLRDKEGGVRIPEEVDPVHDRAARMKPLVESLGQKPGHMPDNLLQIFVHVLHHCLGHCELRIGDKEPAGLPDYVLVDSRAGLADVGSVCVRGLADHLVVFSGLNLQNLEGTRMVLDRVRNHRADFPSPTVVLGPVPEGELALLDERLDDARLRLKLDKEDEPLMLHYHPRLALKEEAFVDRIHRHSRLAYDYERLCSEIQNVAADRWEDHSRSALNMVRENEADDDRKAFEHLVEAIILDESRSRDLIAHVCQSMPCEKWPGFLDVFWLGAAISDANANAWGTLALALSSAARLAFEKANEAEGIRHHEDTERAYQKTLDLDGQPARTHMNWANHLGAMGQRLWDAGRLDEARSLFTEAFERYRKALEITHHYHQALTNWGNELGAMAQRLWDSGNRDDALLTFKEAFEKFRQALVIDPRPSESLNMWGNHLGALAQRYWDEGRREEAQTCFDQAFEKFREALQISSDLPEVLNNWGNQYGALAQKLSGSERRDEAPEVFRKAFDAYGKALQMKPFFPEALNNWAVNLIFLFRLDQQEEHLFEARNKCRDSERIRQDSGAYNLACIEALLRNRDEALAWFETAVRKWPRLAVQARRDPDLESLRDDSRFRQLTGQISP